MKKEADLMELVNGCGVAKGADTKRVPMAKETADLLEELGFKQAASNVKARVNPLIKKAELAAGGYIEITPEKIQEFLNRKAKEYDKKRSNMWAAKSTVSALREYLSVANPGVFTGTALNTLRYDTTFATTTTSTGPWIQDYAGLYQHNYGITVAVEPTQYFHAKTMDYTDAKPGTIGQFLWTEVPVETYAGIPPMDVLNKFKEEKSKKIFERYVVASVNAVRDPLLLGRIDGSTSRYFIAQWGDDVSLDDVI